MTTIRTFPQKDWQKAPALDVNMDAEKLDQAKRHSS